MLANTVQLQPSSSLTGSSVTVFNLNNQLCLHRPSVRRHRRTDVYQQWHQKRLLKHTRAVWIPLSGPFVPQQRETWIWDSGEVTPHIHISAATQAPVDWLQHTRAHLHAHRNYPQQIFPDIHTCCSTVCVCVCVVLWCDDACALFSQTFFSLTWWGEKSSIPR